MSLSYKQKLMAIYDATAPDADGLFACPMRRYVASPVPGTPSWQVFDRFYWRPLSPAEVDAMTVDELLQEFVGSQQRPI